MTIYLVLKRKIDFHSNYKEAKSNYPNTSKRSIDPEVFPAFPADWSNYLLVGCLENLCCDGAGPVQWISPGRYLQAGTVKAHS